MESWWCNGYSIPFFQSTFALGISLRRNRCDSKTFFLNFQYPRGIIEWGRCKPNTPVISFFHYISKAFCIYSLHHEYTVHVISSTAKNWPIQLGYRHLIINGQRKTLSSFWYGYRVPAHSAYWARCFQGFLSSKHKNYYQNKPDLKIEC